MTDLTEITVGFMPLFDSAMLIIAHEKGFATDEGLSLQLVRETSWANIRDRLAVGHFEAAHMLAPMPIASNLGLQPMQVELIVPIALGLGGNAVTISNAVHDAMTRKGDFDIMHPAAVGAALKAVIADRAKARQRPLRFAVVHFFSGHNYELRYWLAGCGISPDRDVEIVVVPPPLMADALAMGTIDGYCVGEPWNSLSVVRGTGHIATVKAAIWQSSPEKVLGIERGWAQKNPAAVEALVRAVARGARWCGNEDNHAELAQIMSSPAYLGLDPALPMPALTGRIATGDGTIVQVPDFLTPFAKAATFPWQSHGLWYYSQMVRWGHAPHSEANELIARDTFRPDIYRRAALPLGLSVPGANMKVIGALATPDYVGASRSGLSLGPDGFFDGRVFDPEQVDAYIAALADNDLRL